MSTFIGIYRSLANMLRFLFHCINFNFFLFFGHAKSTNSHDGMSLNDLALYKLIGWINEIAKIDLTSTRKTSVCRMRGSYIHIALKSWCDRNFARKTNSCHSKNNNKKGAENLICKWDLDFPSSYLHLCHKCISDCNFSSIKWSHDGDLQFN